MSNDDAFNLFLQKCVELGNHQVAKALGVSDAMVSTIRNGKYNASLDKAMERVREAYGTDTVECPALGTIRYGQCAEERRKPFAPISDDYVRHRKACRVCERGGSR
jgi:hypothetical protein